MAYVSNADEEFTYKSTRKNRPSLFFLAYQSGSISQNPFVDCVTDKPTFPFHVIHGVLAIHLHAI